MLEAWLDWLRDPANREVLYLIGAAVAAVVAAGWAVVKFAFGRSGGGSVSASEGSIASGRDTTIGGNVDCSDAPPDRKRRRG